MSIPNSRPLQRRPIHPGEILREEFMPDYGLTVNELATAIGVSRQSVNELLRERRSLSPKMAIRLAQLFDNGAEFWLNLQRAVDLYEARLEVVPKAVAKAVRKPAGAVGAGARATSMAALANQVMKDPRASRIQKSLAASALAKHSSVPGASAQAERTAAMVLRGKRYAKITRDLAASVLAQAREER